MGRLKRAIGVGIGSTTLAAMGVLGTALVAPAAQADPSPCSAAAKACIQLGTQSAWLTHDGVTDWGRVDMASGKPGQETPVGTYSVQYKDIDHWSKAYNAPMPYSVFFTTTGIAFHEGSVSKQSNGCIHLTHNDAVKFYDSLHPGDRVEVVQ